MSRASTSYRRAIRTVREYGRAHRGRLVGGLGGTVAVVALRLAMPWPLRGVLEIAVDASGAAAGATNVPMLGPVGLVPLLTAFVAIGALLGLSEMVQRVQMKRFAADTVRDLRSAAVHSVVRRHGSAHAPEVISRLVEK